jgi:uncharacterized membrane protein
MTKKNAARYVAVNGITAAVYAAVTMATPWMSYGEIQFRIAEAMNLLVFFDPIFAPGLIIGCAVSNIMSQFGIVDIIFGTLATAVALFAMRKVKNLFAATLFPTISNGVIIPLVIMYAGNIPFSPAAFLPIAASVAAGEFAVCSIVGYPLFKMILARWPRLLKMNGRP